jgi:hypothetical protein
VSVRHAREQPVPPRLCPVCAHRNGYVRQRVDFRADRVDRLGIKVGEAAQSGGDSRTLGVSESTDRFVGLIVDGVGKSSDRALRREQDAQRLGITSEMLRDLRRAEGEAALRRKAESAGLTVDAYLAKRRASSKPPTRKMPPAPLARSSRPSGQKRLTNGSANSAKATPAKAQPVYEPGPRPSTAKLKRKTGGEPESKVCRECLREKPLSAFPNPRRRQCEDCGGLPRGTSVSTVSGGAPGQGRKS